MRDFRTRVEGPALNAFRVTRILCVQNTSRRERAKGLEDEEVISLEDDYHLRKIIGW